MGVLSGTAEGKGSRGVSGYATHREGCGPAIKPRSDLRVLVSTDCPRRCVQIHCNYLLFFLLPHRRASSGEEAAHACGTIDDRAPDRYGLGKGIWEALARAR